MKLNQPIKMELIKKSDQNIKTSNAGIISRANDFLSRIAGITKKIQSIAENSESDILLIGKKLQDYLNNSKELFQLSSSVTSMITQEVLKKGVLELNCLLSEFTEYLTKSINNIENDKNELNNIVEKII